MANRVALAHFRPSIAPLAASRSRALRQARDEGKFWWHKESTSSRAWRRTHAVAPTLRNQAMGQSTHPRPAASPGVLHEGKAFPVAASRRAAAAGIRLADLPNGRCRFFIWRIA